MGSNFQLPSLKGGFLMFRWDCVSKGGSEYLEMAELERMTSFTPEELHRAAFWSAIFRQLLAFCHWYPFGRSVLSAIFRQFFALNQ
jgi:hypothetical protein